MNKKTGNPMRVMEQLDAYYKALNSELESSKKISLPCIHCPADVYELVKPIGLLDHEEMWIILLDMKNRVIEVHQLYKGTVNESTVRVAEVFRQAIIKQAPAIIAVHNHPSGDTFPSVPDITLTRQLVQAGKLLGIDFLDHIIVGSSFTSIKESGRVEWR